MGEVIAELVRTRFRTGDEMTDSDLYVCHLADEAELLASKPFLARFDRIETKYLEPAVVVFLPMPTRPA